MGDVKGLIQRLSDPEQYVDAVDEAADALEAMAGHEKLAVDMCNRGDYYRGLLVEVGTLFGKEATIADDGSDMKEVLVAKVPDLVKRLQAELARVKESYRLCETERNAFMTTAHDLADELAKERRKREDKQTWPRNPTLADYATEDELIDWKAKFEAAREAAIEQHEAATLWPYDTAAKFVDSVIAAKLSAKAEREGEGK